jgi:phasin family protein
MATKTNRTNGGEAVEQAMKTGADAMKSGLEQAAKGYERFAGFGKENMEAYMKAATTMTKAFEQINGEVMTFSKQHMEDSMSAFKAVLGARSFQEAWEVQSDFAKTALDSYISQASKLNELWLSSAKQAAEPLSARFAELAEAVQTARPVYPFSQAAE